MKIMMSSSSSPPPPPSPELSGKELAEELHRIVSSDVFLNELAFVPPWKSLRELLGEEEKEEENNNKFYRAFCVREHKLAINARVLVPTLNYVYSQMRRGKTTRMI